VDLDRISDLLPVAYHHYGDYIACQCLFHDDSRPSMFIYPDKYRCEACGAWGWSANLLKKLELDSGRIVRPNAKVDFNNPFSRWMANQTLVDALKFAWKNNKKSPSLYMRDRGISPKDQIRLGIGIRDGWITFPIRNEHGKIIGATARALDNKEKAKYVVPAHQDPNLLYVPDPNLLQDTRRIFITFGIIDAVTLSIYGFPSASTTSGKRIDASSLHHIRKLLLFIPDRHEEADANKIASQLDWRGKVIKVNYPDGCKDINDVHIKHPELLEEMKREWKIQNSKSEIW